MKHKIWLPTLVLLVAGCKSNPNKVQDISTKLDQSAKVSGGEKVGVKDGEMVVLQKEQMAEKLRDLQNTVYSLEDQVYGTRKFGTLGQYGELKTCQRKLASKQYGGSGSLVWTEPLDRVTDKEEDFQIGLDEKKDLVAVSQEYLRDRIQRFQGYKQILQKRSDEFAEKTETCKSQLASHTQDTSESSKVMVSEVPKASTDKAQINQFMCGYVRAGASLENLMTNAFARGWLSLSDFDLAQNLIASTLKDAKGEARPHGMLFNGWKLVFDQSPVSVSDVMSQRQDAHLMAWAFDHKADVPSSGSCLSAPDGEWNH